MVDHIIGKEPLDNERTIHAVYLSAVTSVFQHL
jgi:hypothetical protein